eukprot:15189492-Alexandrium_andersonii.AAC.1
MRPSASSSCAPPTALPSSGSTGAPSAAPASSCTSSASARPRATQSPTPVAVDGVAMQLPLPSVLEDTAQHEAS